MGSAGVHLRMASLAGAPTARAVVGHTADKAGRGRATQGSLVYVKCFVSVC